MSVLNPFLLDIYEELLAMIKNLFRNAILIASVALAGSVVAADCEITIEANDAMRYGTSEISIDKSCQEFTVHLKHVGKLPAASMGHNWVLSKTADVEAISKDAIAAGRDNGYLKADDSRVIAHTKMLGGGEEDSVTFETSKLKGDEGYAFFCSFPGHYAMMKGHLKL